MPVAALLCSLGGIVICVSFLVAIGIDTEKQVANIPDGTEEAANISDGIEEAENISDMTEEDQSLPNNKGYPDKNNPSENLRLPLHYKQVLLSTDADFFRIEEKRTKRYFFQKEIIMKCHPKPRMIWMNWIF